MNEFVSISELFQSRKDKIPINSIKGLRKSDDITVRCLFDSLIISGIVKRICKTVVFLIAADWS